MGQKRSEKVRLLIRTAEIFVKPQDMARSIYDSRQVLLLSFDLSMSLINLEVYLSCLLAVIRYLRGEPVQT